MPRFAPLLFQFFKKRFVLGGIDGSTSAPVNQGIDPVYHSFISSSKAGPFKKAIMSRLGGSHSSPGGGARGQTYVDEDDPFEPQVGGPEAGGELHVDGGVATDKMLERMLSHSSLAKEAPRADPNKPQQQPGSARHQQLHSPPTKVTAEWLAETPRPGDGSPSPDDNTPLTSANYRESALKAAAQRVEERSRSTTGKRSVSKDSATRGGSRTLTTRGGTTTSAGATTPGGQRHGTSSSSSSSRRSPLRSSQYVPPPPPAATTSAVPAVSFTHQKRAANEEKELERKTSMSSKKSRDGPPAPTSLSSTGSSRAAFSPVSPKSSKQLDFDDATFTGDSSPVVAGGPKVKFASSKK